MRVKTSTAVIRGGRVQLAAMLLVWTTGCGAGTGIGAPTPASDALASAAATPGGSGGATPATDGVGAGGVQFSAVQDTVGLAFRHVNGAAGGKFMVETMGAGGGLLDVDNDGDLDAYLVQGGPLPGTPGAASPPNQLFLNDGHGAFRDATADSGAGAAGYGMGTCFGDVTNDGWVDIYVVNFGPDVLLRNDGDGSFTDATAAAGIDNPAWGSSCAMADYDRDGWLDVFVANYVDHSMTNNKRCGPPDTPMYCHPDVYDGVRDVLFRNTGGGVFEDVTAAAGLADTDPTQGKGLGAAWFDADDDGWIDLFVANDSTRQFLYHNGGDGTFREIGVQQGVAFDAEGKTEAGMGIAIGDIDLDRRLDLFLTTLDVETNTLYHQGEGGWFEDLTDVFGLGTDPLSRVGFGTALFDAEHDGDLDLYVANGHIIDNIDLVNPRLTFEQTDQFYLNDGAGHFADVSASVGPALAVPGVGRTVSVGDVDGDVDLDVLVTHNDRPAVLLRNDAARGGHAVALDLRSRHGGRPAVGARVTVTAGGRTWVRELMAGGTYQGQHGHLVHVGLGDVAAVDEVVVRWPEGDVQTVAGSAVALDAVTRIDQGSAP